MPFPSTRPAGWLPSWSCTERCGGPIWADSLVEVVTVEKNGPAERAGLETGDCIFSLNDEQVATVDDLHRLLSRWPSGSPLEVKFLRNGRVISIRITPREG